MPRTGASQEIGTGGTPFPFGLQKTWKKLYVWDPSRNSKNCQAVVTLLTYIESLLIKSPSHQSKVRVYWEESLRCSTAGSNQDLCHTHKFTTHLMCLRKNSIRDSQLTSLQKVLIKPEVGSTLWWLSQQQWREKLHSKTWLSMVLFWLKMAARCLRVRRIILTQCSLLTSLVLMLADCTYVTVLLSELNP